MPMVDRYGNQLTDARPFRDGGTLQRSAVAAVDKLALPGVITTSAITEAGSTLGAVAYFVGLASGNRWGSTGAGAIPASITPVANQAVRLAAVVDAGSDYVDVFLSVDAAPKWVGRVTLAQFTTGDRIISAVGVVSARAGATVANTIDVGIPGTGLQTSVNPFVVNNAYTPAVPTPISCAGFSVATIHVKVALADLRSLPTLSIVPFFQDQLSGGDWFQGAPQTVSLLTAVGQSLEQDFRVLVDGSTNLVILLDTLTGQGAAVSAWVELA